MRHAVFGKAHFVQHEGMIFKLLVFAQIKVGVKPFKVYTHVDEHCRKAQRFPRYGFVAEAPAVRHHAGVYLRRRVRVHFQLILKRCIEIRYHLAGGGSVRLHP